MTSALNVRIGHLKERHILQVIELLQELSNFRPLESQHVNIYRKFLEQDNVHARVAIIDNQVVGFGAIIISSNIRGGRLGHIEDIVSHPSHRRAGIGKLLVENLVAIAAENNCYKIVLASNSDNLQFYQKCGFSVSSFSMENRQL